MKTRREEACFFFSGRARIEVEVVRGNLADRFFLPLQRFCSWNPNTSLRNESSPAPCDREGLVARISETRKAGKKKHREGGHWERKNSRSIFFAITAARKPTPFLSSCVLAAHLLSSLADAASLTVETTSVPCWSASVANGDRAAKAELDTRSKMRRRWRSATTQARIFGVRCCCRLRPLGGLSPPSPGIVARVALQYRRV